MLSTVKRLSTVKASKWRWAMVAFIAASTPPSMPPPPSRPDHNLWWLGVIFMVSSTIAGAFGGILIKKSHLVRQNRRLSWIYWLIGIFAFQAMLNVGMSMAALAFAAQSLLSPLIACQIVFNAALAPCLLEGESLTWLDLVATALIVAGCVLAGIFAPHSDQHYTLHELLADFAKKPFLIYAAACTTLVVAAYMSSLQSRLPALQRISTATLPGFFVGNANIFAKVAASLVAGALQHGDWSPFTKPLPYIVLIVAPCMAATSLGFLNRALARYSATQVVPTYISTLIVVSTVSGGLFFGEFQRLRLGHALGLAAGVALVVCGVCVQASGAREVTVPAEHSEALARSFTSTESVESDYDAIMSLQTSRLASRVHKRQFSIDGGATQPAPPSAAQTITQTMASPSQWSPVD